MAGIAAYERSLRAYVIRNQDIALERNDATGEVEPAANGGIPDFGALTLPFAFRS